MKSPGIVYLVGAGPGDPALITEKGKSLLARADLVLYDQLANPSLLLGTKGSAKKVFVGKIGGSKSTRQSAINRMLAREAQRGKVVVRLKGGDPILFGRGAEEARYLATRRIPFEIVPGVSSALAVPACAGIPLTMRGVSSSVTILTGHEAGPEKGVDWERLLRADSTFVVLMGMKNIAAIVERFINAGKSPRLPAALIARGTTPCQHEVTAPLGRIVAAARLKGISAPAILVVGNAVACQMKMAVARRSSLRGVRVLVARPPHQAEKLTRLLESRGAIPVLAPLIEIRPPRRRAPLDMAIRNLGRYDWLIFTSVNGVRAFMERLRARGRDARALAPVKCCAIGEPTESELAKWGVRADCVPRTFTTRAIVKKLAALDEIRGKSFLLPRGDLAGRELPEAIRRRGGRCEELVIYRAVTSARNVRAAAHALENMAIHLVLLTSPSIASAYAKALARARNRKFQRPLCAAIGPVTAAAARRSGMRVAFRAGIHTDEGLVKALVGHWRGKRRGR